MRRISVFLVVLFASYCEAIAQFGDRVNSDVQWTGLALVNSANRLSQFGKYCGVYSTAVDRQAGKLSVAIDCKSEDHKLKPGFDRDKSVIKIVRRQKTEKFYRHDLYGYRDCRGKEYHFFEGQTYELINPGESIPIYRSYRLHGKQRLAEFFFGSRNGNLKPLTLDQFYSEFTDAPAFLEDLRRLASNDFELVKYRYLINRVRDNSERVSDPRNF